jgi:hypothetical protein
MPNQEQNESNYKNNCNSKSKCNNKTNATAKATTRSFVPASPSAQDDNAKATAKKTAAEITAMRTT